MRTIILPVILALLQQAASAQRTDFSFINFNSKDGLSSNTVNAIQKDRYGYMWFATDDGINKFDGVNFTVYRHHPGDSNSIPIISVFEDSRPSLLRFHKMIAK